MITNKLRLMIGALAVGVTVVGTTALAFSGEQQAGNSLVYAAPNTTLNCGSYSTDIEKNISREEIANLPSFNSANMKACSSILSDVSYGGYCARDTTYSSLRIGSGKQGSITFTLTESINAIGFYACAYQNDKDTGKSLLINNVELSKKLPACQQYSFVDDLRFFYELPEPTDTITIKAKEVSNNRFHLYSVGFYKSN